MTKKYDLAKRVAKAMGMELEEGLVLVSKDSNAIAGTWVGRNSFSRLGTAAGIRELAVAASGWTAQDVPPWLDKNTTPDELDLRLTAMGF